MTRNKDIKVDQKQTQEITKEVDWEKNTEAKLWVELSIQSNCLKVVDVAEMCSENDPQKRTPETWRQKYYDMRELGFETYWRNRFREEYKIRVGTKVYSRLDTLLDKERRIDQIVKAGEFVEGKSQGSQQYQQINGNTITFVNFRDESKG